MATIINNRATVNYRYGSNTAATVSNTTSVNFENALAIQKTSLSDSYRIGQDITYIVTLQNGSDNELTIDVTDDLGTYTFNENEYAPLTFTGDAQLFINGVFDSNLTPTVGTNELVFENIVIPENANAFILYSATVNEFADVGDDSEITNTVTADVTCDCPCAETVSDSNTITAEEFADLRLVKSASPNTVICGETITYVIDVLNYGNTAATEVVITDTFDPALTDITVTVGGVVLSEDDYDYTNGVLTIPSEDSELELTVPPATRVQNPTTGVFETIPSTLQIVITGTV